MSFLLFSTHSRNRPASAPRGFDSRGGDGAGARAEQANGRKSATGKPVTRRPPPVVERKAGGRQSIWSMMGFLKKTPKDHGYI